MAVRFNRDAHSFHIFRVYHSLSLPGEEWKGQVFSGRHSRCWRGHWVCVQSPHCRALASVCQNTLSPKDFLHSSIVFMLGKWQSLFLLQQCCIDPFIIWSEKKDGLKQMWDLLDYCDTLTVNTPFVLIEIANFSIWLPSAEAKTACRLLYLPQEHPLKLKPVHYSRGVILEQLSGLKYCLLLLKNIFFHYE